MDVSRSVVREKKNLPDRGCCACLCGYRSEFYALTEQTKMVLDSKLLDAISEQAKASPRLRMNFDLRNAPTDQSQRMLNALEPGTVMAIHRHPTTTETIVVLRGALREIYYDDAGQVTDTFVCAPGTDCMGLSIPAGQWHSLECLEPGTVLFEAKDGPYEPMKPEDIMNI